MRAILLLLAGGAFAGLLLSGLFLFSMDPQKPKATAGKFHWQPPRISDLDNDPRRELILYGQDLIKNTGFYFGEKGKLSAAGNGMNCQNCHLDAGTRLFGNNYSLVASTYPRFRARSGTVEDLSKRINDCFQRSLNGKTLREGSRELAAMSAYIVWLGKDVHKGDSVYGAGLEPPAFLNRAADPSKGNRVYSRLCANCHGQNGEGKRSDEGLFTIPPVWGEHSYTTAAGMYRISRMAAFVRYNMPHGTHWSKPVLSAEESWDVAAFINSRPRPRRVFPDDWPNIRSKPIDHPFGPYADGFGEKQHKFGPFPPMLAAKKQSEASGGKQ